MIEPLADGASVARPSGTILVTVDGLATRVGPWLAAFTPSVDVLVVDVAERYRVVSDGVEPNGQVVMSADDACLCALGDALRCRVLWYSASHRNERMLASVQAHGLAATVCDGHLLLAQDGAWSDLGRVASIAADADVSSLLAGVLAAAAAGVSFGEIHAALYR